MIFFQNYDKHKKNKNIIWEIRNNNAQNVKKFKEIVEGVSHFKAFFKNLPDLTLQKP